MHYAILIYKADGSLDHLTQEEQKVLRKQHRDLSERMREDGHYRGAIELTEGYSATTVRKQKDGISVEDGPFAEGKELVIGFYLVECDSLETAIVYARRIPHVDWGAIEVRPIRWMNLESGT